MDLETFLEHKPLYYSEIDYSRMPRVYKSIKEQLKIPKIIHVVGTNGKGTTGRFIANMLMSHGKHVGHYSSPHILEFNERIWINGNYVRNSILQAAHERLQELLLFEDSEALSYFEYTTFLAMLCFKDCDYVVLEAGLGGEHDATNVFEKVLSVITPIALDHQDFLGDTIFSIATTKCNSITKRVVVGYQRYSVALSTCKSIAEKKEASFYTIDSVINAQEHREIEAIALKNHLPLYLKENLLLALSAVKLLGFAVDSTSISVELPFGRFYQYRDNIIIDVGHNPLAAEAIAAAFLKKKAILVYNSYADKEYREILKILKPVLERVEILEIDDERIEDKAVLEQSLDELNISYCDFSSIDEGTQYLVFGSFKVVEAFVRGGYA
ncbi:MAG: Mur ligase family protein [Campylobacterota bacterium]|nr:Mur ligase family protein [Campylobacterota bacterium]